jgi:large subunit ribosomal protein L13
MKTHSTSKTEMKANWHHFDAEGKVLGRLAAEISVLLIGKHKANYAPYLNSGDKVVVTNVEKVALTGTKELNKMYPIHSGQVGNFTMKTVEQTRKDTPKKLIHEAVKGMLPKNKLRNDRLANLYLYVGAEHPHHGQVAGNSETVEETN